MAIVNADCPHWDSKYIKIIGKLKRKLKNTQKDLFIDRFIELLCWPILPN